MTKIVFRAVLLSGLAAGSSAQAAMTISAAPTRDVTCSSGVCTTTKHKANLNTGDLEALLATSDVTVATGSKAHDMAVTGAVSWASTHTLTLDSFSALAVRQPVIAEGHSGVTVVLEGNDAGGLTFEGKGRIAFWDTTSSLKIGNISYKLVGDLASLAQAFHTDPDGSYALAGDYDASADGTYDTAVVVAGADVIQGALEGAGNTIRKLKIRGTQSGQTLGLFDTFGGVIRNLKLDKLSIQGKEAATIGGLAGENFGGYIVFSSVSGHIGAGTNSRLGGLVGHMGAGEIVFSSSSGSVSGRGTGGIAGGLVGLMDSGQAVGSFSTAEVTGGVGWTAGGAFGGAECGVLAMYATGIVRVGDNGTAGGLIGNFSGFGSAFVLDTYATGFVGGGVGSTVGGLIGFNNHGPVQASYSTGAVASGSGNAVGGFVGNDAGESDLSSDYWDIETSGQSHGAGNNTGDTGITGLTTAQFQSGLPSGFDSHWAEKAGVNNGFPYLAVIPPR